MRVDRNTDAPVAGSDARDFSETFGMRFEWEREFQAAVRDTTARIQKYPARSFLAAQRFFIQRQKIFGVFWILGIKLVEQRRERRTRRIIAENYVPTARWRNVRAKRRNVLT